MTKVQQLEEEIKKLSAKELAELRDWLLELDWEQWDQQIERDAADGKLDKLFSEALADHRAGKSKKL
jgi:predicted unusual protein kinase regulating ubiquinone biosynthesis (AarF/ABC1/UbiB family)